MAAAVLKGLAAGGRAASAAGVAGQVAAAGLTALPPSPARNVKRPHTTPAEHWSSGAPVQPPKPAKRPRSSLKVRAPLDYRVNDRAIVENYTSRGTRYRMPTSIKVGQHAVAFYHMSGMC
jgi:hypothetical protein